MTPTAVAWYESESDYANVMSMMPPKESALAVHYAQYLRNLEKFEKGLPAKGYHPVRVKIKPEAIKAWASSQNRAVCREIVMNYAMVHLGGQILDKSSN